MDVETHPSGLRLLEPLADSISSGVQSYFLAMIVKNYVGDGRQLILVFSLTY